MVKDGQCVHPEGYISDIITTDAIQFISETASILVYYQVVCYKSFTVIFDRK